MDKLKSGRTITIKLKSNDKIYPEPPKMAEDEVYFMNDDFIETAEDQGNVETAVAEEKAEESFDWILPEITDNDLSEYKIVKQEKKAKNQKSGDSFASKKNGGYKSIVFAVVIAVLVGTSFGFIMLKLVISGQPSKQAVVTVNDENLSLPATNKKYLNVKLMPISTFVIQEGVYSSKESAVQAATVANEKGVPAQVIPIDGREYLFLGTAKDKEHAKIFGSEFAKKGFNIYVKSITLPEKTINKVTNEEQEFLQKSVSMYFDLASAASSVISNEEPSKEVMKRVIMSSMLTAIPSKNVRIKQMENELIKASKIMASYRNINDRDLAVKSQQHLLKFLMIYNSF